MKQIWIYLLFLLSAWGLTACDREPINLNESFFTALSWADEADKGTPISNVTLWCFDTTSGRQVLKRRYKSKQEAALGVHSLPQGDYWVVATINLSPLFVPEGEDAFSNFVITTPSAGSFSTQMHYSVTRVRSEQGKATRVPFPLRRLLSELSIEIEGAPTGTKLTGEVSNVSKGVSLTLKESDGSWGRAGNVKANVQLPEALQGSTGPLSLRTLLMPTVAGMTYSYLTLVLRLPDGTIKKSEVEAPIMKPAGKYHLKLAYTDLKPFVHVEPIWISDWIESWTVNGSILNPSN